LGQYPPLLQTTKNIINKQRPTSAAGILFFSWEKISNLTIDNLEPQSLKKKKNLKISESPKLI
jgi:hypothetical protein